MTNIEQYKSELKSLIDLGITIQADLNHSNKNIEDYDEEMQKKLKIIKGAFQKQYQNWYTESYSIINQLLPSRLNEFEELYKGSPRRKNIDINTFCIQDFANGFTLTAIDYGQNVGLITNRFTTQLNILKSLNKRFESSLFDIKQIVQADLFDWELESAKALSKHKFLRGAGAIAGVVLEKHFKQVMENHSITSRKKHLALNDYNELLKENSIVDIPTWRQIQRLGDIRNLCDHSKDREPTNDEVMELIDGVNKITKTIF